MSNIRVTDQNIPSELLCVSNTSLNEYDQCSFKYAFRRELSLQQPKKSELIFGGVGHKACELYATGVFKTPKQIKEYMLKMFKARTRVFPTVAWFEQQFLDSDELRTLMAEEIVKTVKVFAVKDTEIHLMRKVYVNNVPFLLQGYIDAVTRDGSLVDWKFAKLTSLNENYKKQLATYAALYGNLKKDVVTYSVVFPKVKLKKIHEFVPHVERTVITVDVQERTLWAISLSVKGIKGEIYHPNRGPGNIFCKSCPYHHVCTMVLKGVL